MKERQLEICCILGSLLSLLVLYIFVLAAESDNITICSLNNDYIGKTVTLSGTISGISESKGNIFFTLEYNGCEIDVVLWDSVRRALEGSMNVSEAISLNKSIMVTGHVEVHSGMLQIIPGRPDIKPLS